MQNADIAERPEDHRRQGFGITPTPSKRDACPDCGRPRPQWRENNGRGCPGDDGEIYCGQLCAGKIERR